MFKRERQLVRKRWELNGLKSAITKRAENTEEKTREETEKLLRIARNDNMSFLLKQLKEFSGGKCFGYLRIR